MLGDLEKVTIRQKLQQRPLSPSKGLMGAAVMHGAVETQLNMLVQVAEVFQGAEEFHKRWSETSILVVEIGVVATGISAAPLLTALSKSSHIEKELAVYGFLGPGEGLMILLCARIENK